MTIVDLSATRRLTFKAMTAATADLGVFQLKSGSEYKNGVYFPETDTLVVVAPQKHRDLVEFCRGSLEAVPYTPADVWEWGA